MAKGQITKELVAQAIIFALGEHYIGTYDKKIYCQYEENGEQVQVAISMTCPKTAVQPVSVSHDWTSPESETQVAPTEFVPAEITQEEKDNLQAMMEKLNL